MDALVTRFLAASRKTFFRSKRIFEPYSKVEEADIVAIENKVGAVLPTSLSSWLLGAGFGDLNGEFSFRAEWFNAIDRGPLKGHVIFAQDIGGNFYAFSPDSGAIFFVCRSAPEYAPIAANFAAFMEALESHDFQLQAWTDSLEARPYDWAV